VTLSLLGSTPSSTAKTGTRAVTSRCARGCRVLGHSHFDILAGRSKKVKVHLAHSAGALLRGRHSVQIEAATTLRDAAGHTYTTRTTLTLTRAGRSAPTGKSHRPGAPKPHRAGAPKSHRPGAPKH
jgi:hypothetical protein